MEIKKFSFFKLNTICTFCKNETFVNEQKGQMNKRGYTLISDLISSNRLLISFSSDIFDFIIVTRQLMEE